MSCYDGRSDPDCCAVCGDWLDKDVLQPGYRAHKGCYLQEMAGWYLADRDADALEQASAPARPVPT